MFASTSSWTFCSSNKEKQIQKWEERIKAQCNICLRNLNYEIFYFKSQVTTGHYNHQPNCAIKNIKTPRQVVLPTLTGTPISSEAREACADVGRSAGVHTLSSLRNVTIVRACLAMVYDIFNSCRLDVQKRRGKLELFFTKSEAHNKFTGREEQMWKHTEEKGNTCWGGQLGFFFFPQNLSFQWC